MTVNNLVKDYLLDVMDGLCKGILYVNIYINRSQTLFFSHITQNASIPLCVHIYIPESNANSTLQEKTKQPYAKGIVLLELEKLSVLSLRHAKKLSSSALA